MPPHDHAASRTFTVAAQVMTATKAAPGLHLVATPIGNLGDITLRALQTLAGADLIACEDTRVTRRLTDHYAIAAPLMAYHEHNAAQARPKIPARLQGDAVALETDAGTPPISSDSLVRRPAPPDIRLALPGPSGSRD